MVLWAWSRETSLFVRFAFLALFKVLIRDFFWMDISSSTRLLKIVSSRTLGYLQRRCQTYSASLQEANSLESITYAIESVGETPTRLNKGEKLNCAVKN